MIILYGTCIWNFFVGGGGQGCNVSCFMHTTCRCTYALYM